MYFNFPLNFIVKNYIYIIHNYILFYVSLSESSSIAVSYNYSIVNDFYDNLIPHLSLSNYTYLYYPLQPIFSNLIIP